MENEKNNCYRCKHFDRYYTNEITHFRQTKLGWCCKMRAEISVRDYCENYERKRYHRRYNLSLMHCLNDLLTENGEVRNIMDAEENARREIEDLQ